MAVILKSTVVDQLRAARSADDTFSRLRENSWETCRQSLLRLVESTEWRFGPAELLATFDHHLLAKSPSGDVVQVEWSRGDDGRVYLGRAIIHESSTPVSDLGHEIMETARSAVDKILDESYDDVGPMIEGLTSALDVGGDLQRQIANEVLVQSIARRAWWHSVAGLSEDHAAAVATSVDVGDIQRSTTNLLSFLKEQASALSLVARQLNIQTTRPEVESMATDVAEDVERAISALMGLDRRNVEEVTKVYEAIMTAAPQLLSGIAYLKQLSEDSRENSAQHDIRS